MEVEYEDLFPSLEEKLNNIKAALNLINLPKLKKETDTFHYLNPNTMEYELTSSTYKSTVPSITNFQENIRVIRKHLSDLSKEVEVAMHERNKQKSI